MLGVVQTRRDLTCRLMAPRRRFAAALDYWLAPSIDGAAPVVIASCGTASALRGGASFMRRAHVCHASGAP
jgi:hypothetical protein